MGGLAKVQWQRLTPSLAVGPRSLRRKQANVVGACVIRIASIHLLQRVWLAVIVPAEP